MARSARVMYIRLVLGLLLVPVRYLVPSFSTPLLDRTKEPPNLEGGWVDHITERR